MIILMLHVLQMFFSIFGSDIEDLENIKDLNNKPQTKHNIASKIKKFLFSDCDKRAKPTRHDNRPVAQLTKNVKGHNRSQ